MLWQLAGLQQRPVSEELYEADMLAGSTECQTCTCLSTLRQQGQRPGYSSCSLHREQQRTSRYLSQGLCHTDDATRKGNSAEQQGLVVL